MSEVQNPAPSQQTGQPVQQSAAPHAPGVPGVNGGPTGPRRKTPNVRGRKTIARIIWSCVFLAIAVGLVIAVKIVFYSPEPQYYTTDIVRRMDKLTQQVTGWGYAAPVESLEVRSEVKGKVIESNGFEGMQVHEGDVLCVLDGAELDKAIAAIDKEIDAENTAIEKARESIADTTEKMNEANSDQLQQAKDAVVYAPFSGKIIDVSKETIGASMTKGKTLGTLIDDSVMILRQYFSYGYISDIKTGMKASVSIPASMTVVDGTVTSIEKVKNIQTDGTITFEVEISVKNPGALTKKMAATATLTNASGESILPAGAGELEYSREEIVYAGASGNLKTYNLRNFYEYKQGDLLLQIEFTPDNSAIEGYLSAIKMQEELIAASEQKIEEKQAEKAEQMTLYDKLTVTAPISGTLLMFSANFDQMIDPSVTICNIAQMDRMVIEANIEQANLQYFKVGLSVEVSEGGDDSMPGIPGTVKSISLEGKNDYGYITYPCKIEVDNSDGRLRNSYGVSFKAILAEVESPLVASIDVIKPLIDGECVYVKTKERPENAIDLPEGVVPEGFYAVPVTVGITSRILNQEKYMYEEVVEIKTGVEEGWELHRQKLNVKPSPSPSPSGEEGIDGPVDGESGGEEPGIVDEDPGVVEPGLEEGDPGVIDTADSGAEPAVGDEGVSDGNGGADVDKDSGDAVTDEGASEGDAAPDGGDDGAVSIMPIPGGSGGVVIEPVPIPRG